MSYLIVAASPSIPVVTAGALITNVVPVVPSPRSIAVDVTADAPDGRARVFVSSPSPNL